MLRYARPLIIALGVTGCVPARAPVEDLGLPLVFREPACPRAPSVDEAPDAPPPEPAPPPLADEVCSAVRISLPATHHGVIAREAVVKMLDDAAPALREAVCACPPRAASARLLVTATPDRGEIAARSYAPDAPIDACLAERLGGVALPRWHLGGDCIGCGPRRYGVLPGSPPVDSVPADGIAAVTFLVEVEVAR